MEGAARANFDWFKSGYKFDVAFRAPKSGTIVEASVPWRTTVPGYASGTLGIYTWELQSNGSTKPPSGTILKSVTGLRAGAQTTSGNSPFFVPITASLIAGQVYHFVIYNTDPNPSVNWSSINTVMSRIVPWNPATAPDARGAVAPKGSSSWTPWSPNSDIWNTSGGSSQNGSHIALILKWSDGTVTGDPYWLAAVSNQVTITSARHAGELLV